MCSMCWLKQKRRRKEVLYTFKFENKTLVRVCCNLGEWFLIWGKCQTPLGILWKLRTPFLEECTHAHHFALVSGSLRLCRLCRSQVKNPCLGRRGKLRVTSPCHPTCITFFVSPFFCPSDYFTSSRSLWWLVYMYQTFFSMWSHLILPITSGGNRIFIL